MVRKLVEQIECDGCGRERPCVEVTIKFTAPSKSARLDLCVDCRATKPVEELMKIDRERPSRLDLHRVEPFEFKPQKS